MRGEHAQQSAAGSSPHTRGARDRHRPRRRLRGIIPAYAGSTGNWGLVDHTLRDHPRIRGEHQENRYIWTRSEGSSPHTRGAQKETRTSDAPEGIIPAYAGSTSGAAPESTPTRDHPRIRGEHRSACDGDTLSEGSSPHTRGAHRDAFPRLSAAGIIPAYAGSTSSRYSRRASRRDHPRIRGEHARQSAQSVADKGSSPHTRGAPPLRAAACRHAGIIPAYAGSTTSSRTTRPTCRDHPRIRGEHPTSSACRSRKSGSSPHTRGALYLRHALGHGPGIIPAYAGSTSSWPASQTSSWDHPRIRGEHRLSAR